MRLCLIAVALGLVCGWGAPVAAQVAQRIYGTTSGGVFVPVLIDSTGKLIVVSE